MDNEDYDIDDILNNFNKKKKTTNQKKKGNRGERNLIKELEKRFPGKPFSRTIGSGNRWSQARLTEAAKNVFTSDIVCPENFLFALECKHGYNHINIERAIKKKSEGKNNKQLDKFLNQAEKDANRVDKKPMMCWKQDYKPWIAFLKNEDIPESLGKGNLYDKWSIFPLDKVFELSNDFFMKG